MNTIFRPEAPKFVLLCGGVGGLLALLMNDAEAMYQAAWYVRWYSIILFNLVWITWAGVACLALAPRTIFNASLEFREWAVENIPLLAPRLPAGEAVEQIAPGPDSGNDLLVRFDSPEDAEGFARRGLNALHVSNRKNWVLAVAFAERFCVITKEDGNIISIDRSQPQWQKPEDWTHVGRRFENETWLEYEADLVGICNHYRAWSVSAKIESAAAGTKSVAYFEAFTKVSAVVIFCLFSLALSAQPKSQQAATFLGPQRARMQPVGPIFFRFGSGLEINREGDGKKTIIELLRDGRVYSDADNAGPLVSISVTIGRKLISIVPMPPSDVPTQRTGSAIPSGTSREEMKQFVRPNKDTTRRAEASTMPDTPMEWDSTGMATKLNDTKAKLTGLVIPLWNGVMIGIDIFFYLFLYVIGLARFVSITCNNESRINSWGKRVYGDMQADLGALATAILFILSLILVLIFLTNLYVSAIMGSVSGLFAALFSPKAWFAYGWIFILWIAARAFDKWVPNPKIINRGNYPAKQ